MHFNLMNVIYMIPLFPGLCTPGNMVVSPPTAISAMKFFTDSNQCPILALGTSQGKVLTMAIYGSKGKKLSAISLSQR